MSIGHPLEGLGAGEVPSDRAERQRKEKSRKLGKRDVSKKEKSQKKKSKVERVTEDMRLLSLKVAGPSKSLKMGRISDPLLKTMLQRNIPQPGQISIPPGAEGVYQNPLQQAQYERSCIESLQALLDRLRQDSADKNNLFMRGIYSRVVALVSGIPQSRTTSSFNEETKMAFVKPLPDAAKDIWRTCDKCILAHQGGNGEIDVLQGVHPLAYDAQEVTPPHELNARFLQFLRVGLQTMGHDTAWLPNPQDVTWETPEEVDAWVTANAERIAQDRELCRLLRSGAQERYSGFISTQFILSIYGPKVETDAPISAHIDSKAMQFQRLFRADHTHTETIRLPVTIKYRGQNKELAEIEWTIEVDYDQRCVPLNVRSTAAIR